MIVGSLKQTNTNGSSIGACCNNKRKSAGVIFGNSIKKLNRKERIINYEKIFDYIILFQKYNTLKNHCEMVENNFKNSAYKHILSFESQERKRIKN